MNAATCLARSRKSYRETAGGAKISFLKLLYHSKEDCGTIVSQSIVTTYNLLCQTHVRSQFALEAKEQSAIKQMAQR